jgi:hypothetical protein
LMKVADGLACGQHMPGYLLSEETCISRAEGVMGDPAEAAHSVEDQGLFLLPYF